MMRRPPSEVLYQVFAWAGDDCSRKVLPLGRALYEEYSREILRWHFSPMFDELAKVPPEQREHVGKALLAAMHGSAYWQRLRSGEEEN